MSEKRSKAIEIFQQTGGGIVEREDSIEVFFKEANPELVSTAVFKAMEAGLEPIVDCHAKRVGIWLD